MVAPMARPALGEGEELYPTESSFSSPSVREAVSPKSIATTLARALASVPCAEILAGFR